MFLFTRRRRRNTSESASAVYLAFTTQPGTGGASPYTVNPKPVVAAKKSKGTTDTAKAGTVTIALVALTGSPVLSGTTTKALSSGVADFSANGLTVTGAGTWYLVATLAGLTGATSVTGTTTSSTAATKLTITTAPGLSGATPYTLSPQPVVAAQNAGGATDTSYVTNVVAALNVLTGSPVLSGTTTKTPVSGVATFTDLVVTGAGTWTITFTSGSLTSATSSTGTTTSGGATTYASDSFNRANGSLGPADVGGTWSVSGTAYTIVSNQATGAGGGIGYASLSDGTHSDGVIRVNLFASGGEPGVAFRGSDPDNCYRCVLSGGAFYLQKMVGGGSTTLGGGPWTVTYVSGQELKVVLSGTSISVYYNSVLIGSATDATFSGTAHGLYNTGLGIVVTIWDDYSFKSA